MELHSIGKGIVEGLKKVSGVQAWENRKAAKAAEKEAEIMRSNRVLELKSELDKQLKYLEPLENCFNSDDPYCVETLRKTVKLAKELVENL